MRTTGGHSKAVALREAWWSPPGSLVEPSGRLGGAMGLSQITPDGIVFCVCHGLLHMRANFRPYSRMGLCNMELAAAMMRPTVTRPKSHCMPTRCQ